jgi:hypothetical protein
MGAPLRMGMLSDGVRVRLRERYEQWQATGPWYRRAPEPTEEVSLYLSLERLIREQMGELERAAAFALAQAKRYRAARLREAILRAEVDRLRTKLGMRPASPFGVEAHTPGLDELDTESALVAEKEEAQGRAFLAGTRLEIERKMRRDAEAESLKLRRELEVTQGWLDRFQSDYATATVDVMRLRRELADRAVRVEYWTCMYLGRASVPEDPPGRYRRATEAYEAISASVDQRPPQYTPEECAAEVRACKECHSAMPGMCSRHTDADRAAASKLDREVDVIEAVNSAAALVGCGDSLCLFVRPRGMATNGGCQCLRRPFVGASLARLFKAAVKAVGFEQGREG